MLQCPQCGSDLFALEQTGGSLLFSVNESGEAVAVKPMGGSVALTPSSVVYCTTCSWFGELRALMRDA